MPSRSRAAGPIASSSTATKPKFKAKPASGSVGSVTGEVSSEVSGEVSSDRTERIERINRNVTTRRQDESIARTLLFDKLTMNLAMNKQSQKPTPTPTADGGAGDDGSRRGRTDADGDGSVAEEPPRDPRDGSPPGARRSAEGRGREREAGRRERGARSKSPLMRRKMMDEARKHEDKLGTKM